MTSAQTQLDRAIDGLVATLEQPDRQRHIGGVLAAFDEAGRPDPDYFRSILPPQKLRWDPSGTGFDVTTQAGKSVLAIARAETAPTSGPCVITLAWEAAYQGLTKIGSLQIPVGQRFGQAGESEIGMALPAGAWVKRTMVANGAGGVTVVLVVR